MRYNDNQYIESENESCYENYPWSEEDPKFTYDILVIHKIVRHIHLAATLGTLFISKARR